MKTNYRLLVVLIAYSFLVTEVVAQQSGFTPQDTNILASSVVHLKATTNNGSLQGSGVVINDEGIIFTAAHVVEDAETITVSVFRSMNRAPTQQYTAKIIELSDNIDFAILKITATANGNPVSSFDGMEPVCGWSTQVNSTDRVYFFGYQAISSDFFNITEGVITGSQTHRGNLYLESDATFAPGGSGGMVVNSLGQLVGLPFEFHADMNESAQVASILPMATICNDRGTDACDFQPANSCDFSSQQTGNLTGRLRPADQLACPDTQPAIVDVGIPSQVTFYPPTWNNLRDRPDTSGKLINQISNGTSFEIVDGPVCSDGYRWWLITLGNGRSGWTADGDTSEYWIEPQN